MWLIYWKAAENRGYVHIPQASVAGRALTLFENVLHIFVESQLTLNVNVKAITAF